MSELQINPCHYSKKVKFLGLRGWICIFVLMSMVMPFSPSLHILLIVVAGTLWYIEKQRGYIVEYYFLRLRTVLGGRCRRN